MARALVIGDPHFKVSNAKETDRMADAIVKLAEEIHPDFIVILGDSCDTHDIVHLSPLTRAIKFIAILIEIAPTYILIGNHDLKNNKQFLSEEHPFTALKLINSSLQQQAQTIELYHSMIIELFTITPEHLLTDRLRTYKQIIDENSDLVNKFDKVTIADKVLSVDIKGQQFVFCPYVPTSKFEEALNTIPNWRTAKTIFAHQEFRSAQMGAIISTDGDIWPVSSPFVISGHIHDFQQLQTNIVYTGTPIQHTYSDHTNKTVSVFTFNEEIEHKRYDLGLPHKAIVHITCAEVNDYKPAPNSQLKIVISGHTGELKAIMKHHHINMWKQSGHKITYKDIPLDNSTGEEIYTPGVAPLRYSLALQTVIANEPNLVKLYNSIFGIVPTAQPTNNIIEINKSFAKLSLNISK